MTCRFALSLRSAFAGYQEQVLKAYQKIKNDEKLREKTRKALEIALQLLNENGDDSELEAEKKSA